MRNRLIKPLDQDYTEYLRDESRATGSAESISFPKSPSDVISIVQEMNNKGIPITIQGARTGLAAGAVPYGGHILHLSGMDRILGMRCSHEGRFYVTCEAGVVLSRLNKIIESRKFSTASWNSVSKAALQEFANAEEQFFSPDPTETSATIGGMVANNASGARSYLYGSTRDHVTALRVVLCNGETLLLRRGDIFARGRRISLKTEQANNIDAQLPSYIMPKTKNAAGYYIEDDMDAIDLFIGSGGTLGIITEIELELLTKPKVIWGVNCCFEEEKCAIDFVQAARTKMKNIAALEFYDGSSLEVLRRQKAENPAFSKLRTVDNRISSVIYVELHCENEECAIDNLNEIAAQMQISGAKKEDTSVARTESDRDSLYFFRHAIPESVNMLIDQRKKDNPIIRKLAADMSVPDRYLSDIMEMYRFTLEKNNLESAIWGHVGDNHLHVNILPKSTVDYEKGKALYQKWSSEVSKYGGAVSAEHGIGKLKTDQLALMYGAEHIEEMRKLKAAFDPRGLLCPGNLFTMEGDGGK